MTANICRKICPNRATVHYVNSMRGRDRSRSLKFQKIFYTWRQTMLHLRCNIQPLFCSRFQVHTCILSRDNGGVIFRAFQKPRHKLSKSFRSKKKSERKLFSELLRCGWVGAGGLGSRTKINARVEPGLAMCCHSANSARVGGIYLLFLFTNP